MIEDSPPLHTGETCWLREHYLPGMPPPCAIAAFCSWNRSPSRWEPFMCLSTHRMTQPSSRDVSDLLSKPLTQESKHCWTRLEYIFINSFICFFSMRFCNSRCSFAVSDSMVTGGWLCAGPRWAALVVTGYRRAGGSRRDDVGVLRLWKSSATLDEELPRAQNFGSELRLLRGLFLPSSLTTQPTGAPRSIRCAMTALR